MKYKNTICWSMLVIILMICCSCWVGAAECVTQFPVEYSEYLDADAVHDSVVRVQSDFFTPAEIKEADSYEIIHITEMYENWYSDEVRYFLMDIAWNTGSNSTFILSAEDGHVVLSFNALSYYFRHLGIEGIKDPANRLMYEGGLNYYVIITDPETNEEYVEDCRTGERYYDLEQYENPVISAAAEDDVQISEQDSEIVMTEKQIRKMRERQEYVESQNELYSARTIDPARMKKAVLI